MRSVMLLVVAVAVAGCGGAKEKAAEEKPAGELTEAELRKEYARYLDLLKEGRRLHQEDRREFLDALTEKRAAAIRAGQERPAWDGKYPPGANAAKVAEIASEAKAVFEKLETKWRSLGLDPERPSLSP